MLGNGAIIVKFVFEGAYIMAVIFTFALLLCMSLTGDKHVDMRCFNTEYAHAPTTASCKNNHPWTYTIKNKLLMARLNPIITGSIQNKVEASIWSGLVLIEIWEQQVPVSDLKLGSAI